MTGKVLCKGEQIFFQSKKEKDVNSLLSESNIKYMKTDNPQNF
jgi:hypothetical protein